MISTIGGNVLAAIATAGPANQVKMIIIFSFLWSFQNHKKH